MPRRSPDPLDSMPDLADDGAMAAKRGRPPKPEGEKRDVFVNVRVTPGEKERILLAAETRKVAIADLFLQGIDALEKTDV